MDEFQKFTEVLAAVSDASTLVSHLFNRKGAGILVMSATPYVMYSMRQDAESHHEELFKTLRFLWKAPPGGTTSEEQRYRDYLQMFDQRFLKEMRWLEGRDEALFQKKLEAEALLRAIMCRTERNWYIDDAEKGVKAVGDAPEELATLQPAEASDYLHMQRFLKLPGNENVCSLGLTDFWASCSSVLGFMDVQYKLVKDLRKSDRKTVAVPVPETLPKSVEALYRTGRDNLKVRSLLSKVFARDPDPVSEESDTKARPWKYLWTAPTYRYYRDTFFQKPPRKFLVFSHWRFVPNAVAALVSHAVENRIPTAQKSLPLKPKKTFSHFIFDVCHPSWVLAKLVQPLDLLASFPLSSSDDLPMVGDLIKIAERNVRRSLRQRGVDVGGKAPLRLWEVVAWMEGRDPIASKLDHGFHAELRAKAGGARAARRDTYLQKQFDAYRDFMENDSGRVSLSEKDFRKLVRVALFSPGVSILRSILSVFPEDEVRENYCRVVEFGFRSLRNYLNKPLVQGIVRHDLTKPSYVDLVLTYFRDGQFQAVMDEYAYLATSVLQCDSVAKLVDRLGDCMGMYSGAPSLQVRSGRRLVAQKGADTHFALEFGEDVSSREEETAEVGVRRKSSVREAFNSPFWPFVLATTSRGQEGLDFHLFCRDVVHWNLPVSPVDLEQREGRVNRRGGLVVRLNVAQDVPITRLPPSGNPWTSAFREIELHPDPEHRFMHGLYPHWIYKPRKGKAQMIQRHLMFYAGSRDVVRYKALKESLSVYRLVFGQPRQQEFVETLREKLRLAGKSLSDDSLLDRVSAYMLNLSPVTGEKVWQRSLQDAEALIDDVNALDAFQVELEMFVRTAQLAELHPVLACQVLAMLGMLKCPESCRKAGRTRVTAVVASLLYLRNPYDGVFDSLDQFGWMDDIERLQKAHQAVKPFLNG
jgi:hypothetical protein